MADTIREKIIQKMVTRAAAITVAGGYNTGMGSNVLRAVHEVDPENLPAVIIWPLEEASSPSYGQDNPEMIVDIEGMALHGSTNPSVFGEKMLGDLRKCFTDPASVATYFSGVTVDEIVYAGGGISSYPKGDDLVTGAKISLKIKYFTMLGNPYSQS